MLAEIDALDVPELLVFNKADRDPDSAKQLVHDHEGSVAISALAGTGTKELLEALGDRLRSMATIAELLIPYERGDVLASVHREGEVISIAHEPQGIRIRARLAERQRRSIGRVRGEQGLIG